MAAVDELEKAEAGCETKLKDRAVVRFLEAPVSLSVLFQRQSHGMAYIDTQVLPHREAVLKRFYRTSSLSLA